MSPQHASIAQLVRAPSLYLGGPWFESKYSHINSSSNDGNVISFKFKANIGVQSGLVM